MIEVPAQAGPICQAQVKQVARYPKYVCRACLAQGVVVNGEAVPVEELNIGSLSQIECFVAGVRCIANEAHFGGCVVQLAPN